MYPRRLHRILFAALFACVLAACSSLGALGLIDDEVRFTPTQLQHSLDRSFPKHYEKLGGLVSLTLMNPRLSIPEGASRLRVDFDVGVGALGSDSSRPSGRFALSSALRFDPGTRGLHLQDPKLETVEVPGLGGAMNASSRALLNAWMSEYAREEPIYRFDNSLLDRLGSRRIGSTQIEQGAVVVRLDP